MNLVNFHMQSPAPGELTCCDSFYKLGWQDQTMSSILINLCQVFADLDPTADQLVDWVSQAGDANLPVAHGPLCRHLHWQSHVQLQHDMHHKMSYS